MTAQLFLKAIARCLIGETARNEKKCAPPDAGKEAAFAPFCRTQKDIVGSGAGKFTAQHDPFGLQAQQRFFCVGGVFLCRGWAVRARYSADLP